MLVFQDQTAPLQRPGLAAQLTAITQLSIDRSSLTARVKPFCIEVKLDYIISSVYVEGPFTLLYILFS